MADPLDELAALRATAMRLDAHIGYAVAAAREDGATWQEIADALGISRQAAHQRFRDVP